MTVECFSIRAEPVRRARPDKHASGWACCSMRRDRAGSSGNLSQAAGVEANDPQTPGAQLSITGVRARQIQTTESARRDPVRRALCFGERSSGCRDGFLAQGPAMDQHDRVAAAIIDEAQLDRVAGAVDAWPLKAPIRFGLGAAKPATRRPAYAPHAPHGKGSAVGTAGVCARIAAPRASRRRPG
jgi:hypothetical protein